jgi:hypothetical protein
MKQASLFHHLTSVQFCSEGVESRDEKRRENGKPGIMEPDGLLKCDRN